MLFYYFITNRIYLIVDALLFGLGDLMIATNATCLCEISVTQHKLFNSVPW